MSHDIPGLAEKLMLPGPGSADGTTIDLAVDSDSSAVKLDDLGPMVVNSDGTLSRIANWANMTQPERERTMRVLNTRNKVRLAGEEKKLRDQGDPTSVTSGAS